MNNLSLLEEQVETLKQEVETLEKQVEDARWLLQRANQKYDESVSKGDSRGVREYGSQYGEKEAKANELKARLDTVRTKLTETSLNRVLASMEHWTAEELDELERRIKKARQLRP